MDFQKQIIEKNLIVVGAGLPGIVAAVQAARLGLSVALINDRGYLGGNASAEINVQVNGADASMEFNFFARETGIVEEIRLENLHRNPQSNRYIWDTVLLDLVQQEKNIQLFLNTNVDSVEVDDTQKITAVSGSQLDSEKRFVFRGTWFLDDTGDGTVGVLAGAEYRQGREAKAEFGERIAPDQADHYVIPSTLNFYAKDTGRPVRYIPPKFALDLTKSDILQYRPFRKTVLTGASGFMNWAEVWIRLRISKPLSRCTVLWFTESGITSKTVGNIRRKTMIWNMCPVCRENENLAG